MLTEQLSRDEIMRLGARQYFKELNTQLRALMVAYPWLADEPTSNGVASAAGTKAPKVKATKATTQRSAAAELETLVSEIVQAEGEKIAPADLFAKVKARGFKFFGDDEPAAVARACARLVKAKHLKKTGTARGTRYATA